MILINNVVYFGVSLSSNVFTLGQKLCSPLLFLLQYHSLVAGLGGLELFWCQFVTAKGRTSSFDLLLGGDLHCAMCPKGIPTLLVDDWQNLSVLLGLFKALLTQLGYHKGFCHAHLLLLPCLALDPVNKLLTNYM